VRQKAFSFIGEVTRKNAKRQFSKGAKTVPRAWWFAPLARPLHVLPRVSTKVASDGRLRACKGQLAHTVKVVWKGIEELVNVGLKVGGRSVEWPSGASDQQPVEAAAKVPGWLCVRRVQLIERGGNEGSGEEVNRGHSEAFFRAPITRVRRRVQLTDWHSDEGGNEGVNGDGNDGGAEGINGGRSEDGTDDSSEVLFRPSCACLDRVATAWLGAPVAAWPGEAFYGLPRAETVACARQHITMQKFTNMGPLHTASRTSAATSGVRSASLCRMVVTLQPRGGLIVRRDMLPRLARARYR
jgi:hypothetical protein